MATVEDDLGHRFEPAVSPRRIVSLVPSLTEALAATVPDRLVGATEWCTHPAGLAVGRVRGTKNPDHAAIGALRPDLVVANQEENRRTDVERLRRDGIPVWVTRIESVNGAIASLGRLLADGLSVPEPAWLREAADVWAQPAPLPPLRTVVPIWRRPWMVVGSGTYTGDVLARLGLVNAFGDAPDRYPRLEEDGLLAAGADLVLLPDEPYAFSVDDGPEAFPAGRAVLVSGRSLTWYGPAMVGARNELVGRITAAIRTVGPTAD
jgi:ABC-type Fe3+-hydroxamate transport system substrate-binding protein